MEKTIQLYAKDPYLKDCHGTVVGVYENEIVFDRTVFFPEGGGQPSDTGKVFLNEKNDDDDDGLNIIHVYEKDGLIYHRTEDSIGKIKIGDTLNCTINWERRFSHMQRHCGEHILSAAFYDLYGGINRGFHMGEDYMTIDISLETIDEFKDMTDEMIDAVEWEANRYIWSNLPVTTKVFESREEAENHPMRKPLQLDEDIVLVCVGDENNAAGCVACCGTHPATTGEVGLIKIYRWENYKGMQRITFDAGPNALVHVRKNEGIIKTLNIRYSSDSLNLMDNIDIRENKAGEIRQELYQIKQAYFKQLAGEVDKALRTSDTGPVIFKNDILKVDDLLSIAKIIDLPERRLLALVSEKKTA